MWPVLFLIKSMQIRKKIIDSGDNTLKEKFSQFDQLVSDKDKSNYEKAAMAGNILADVARDIISFPDPRVKKSGINIINSFLNVAKETQNQLLINTAIKISDNISALI